MADFIINSANTLDVQKTPGQDLRFPTTSSESIFTFGNFRLEKNLTPDILERIRVNKGFSNFSTLQTLSSSTFNSHEVLTTTTNELNPKTSDAQSYAYFGSFFTKVAAAINNIIANFPYAILSSGGSSNSLFSYSNNLGSVTSSFRLPISGLTNQGNIAFISGASVNNTILTLFDNFNQFGIQLSAATTAQTVVHDITSFSYQTGYTGYLQFTVKGFVFSSNTISASTAPIYVRPSSQRFGQYKRTISNLENQLLFDGVFLVPDVDDDTFSNQTFTWPKTIDGFAPDSFGSNFDDYTEEILNSCKRIDEIKTDWMIRTMIPENHLDLDTDTQIYRKLISVYAEEFDKVKQYIDSLAFMHSVSYDNQENIPDKFLFKLSKLLGFKFSNAFNEADIFEYLAGESDDSGKSFSDYNFELWKKILININWLYKKKGTRDALSFIFKLIGAPDCLVNFDEFVYRVNRVTVDSNSGTTLSDKINERGFINFDASQFPFQQGENGMDYVNQWAPEFELEKIVDNKKVYTGDTNVNGTENIFNSKELCADISSASAIECDVKQWYDLGFGIWNWGTSASTFFSGLTVPFEWTVDEFNCFATGLTTGMTISQWMDYIYTCTIDPRTRKVEGNSNNPIYMNLKKIYMTYMLWTNNQESNRLTFRKLEKFLSLIERNFQDYIPQLIPATTILDCRGTTYRNTLFNRQKFVYPKGINDGSEFQIALPPVFEPKINAVKVSAKINDIIKPIINAVEVTGTVNNIIKPIINAVEVTGIINDVIKPTINAVEVSAIINNIISPNINVVQVTGVIREEDTSTKFKKNTVKGTIIDCLDNHLVSFDNT